MAVKSLAGLCTAGAMPAGSVLAEGAEHDDTPLAITARIYAHYRKEGSGFDLQGAEARRVLSQRLRALAMPAAARAGGGGEALDFDPFCSCQDFDLTEVRMAEQTDTDRSEVRVTFSNFGKPGTVRLKFKKTPSGWQLDDIRSPDVASLAASLQRAARERRD